VRHVGLALRIFERFDMKSMVVWEHLCTIQCTALCMGVTGLNSSIIVIFIIIIREIAPMAHVKQMHLLNQGTQQCDVLLCRTTKMSPHMLAATARAPDVLCMVLFV
jgi:hypothetical protein